MNRVSSFLSAFLSAVLLMSACSTIHEYPEGEGVDLGEISLDLSLEIDMSLDDSQITQTYSSMLQGDYDIRYIVDIYKVADTYAETVGSLERRIVKTESTIIEEGTYHIDEQIKLKPALYSVMVWVDFVKKGTEDDLYYDTDNLHEVRIILQDGVYTGYQVSKDAFTASRPLDMLVFQGKRDAVVEMSIPVMRPFAVYQVVTTDIEKYKTSYQSYSYANIRPTTTTLAYSLYFPLGYNVYYGVPDEFKAGVSYEYDVVETIQEQEAILASDFVFIDDKDTFYNINFSVHSAEGKLINTVRDIKVNLSRNKMTIVRGEFLTTNLDDGEVGIDPGFDDEIIVPID